MNRCFLFNPENDIALGMNLERFTPPRQAALLHQACAAVPFWLGEEGDCFLTDPRSLEATERWLGQLGIPGPSPVASIDGKSPLVPTPWGWSRNAALQFREYGMAESCLSPFTTNPDVHRTLSHRRTGLRLLELLVADGFPLMFPLPLEADSITAVTDAVKSFGTAYVKSPWSSSGRGVFPVDMSRLPASQQRIEGIIRSQGSVMVEKSLCKILDFAMLFSMADDKAMFEGFSLFVNSTATNYGGNLVASDDDIVSQIGKYAEAEAIYSIRERIEGLLPALLDRNYIGPLGIDMMLFRGTDGEVYVNPCVELNLRYTMGFVARGVYHKLGLTGWMRMQHKAAPESGAAVIDSVYGEEGKAISLVPRNPWFDFTFKVQA